MPVFEAVGIDWVVVLQPEFLPFRDAVGFDDTRSFFTEFAVFHDCGSVVQTYSSEQRAESPSEGGKAIVSVEHGIVREGDESVQTQNIQCVISANGNLDAGHGPAELDSRGAVKHAACCAE